MGAKRCSPASESNNGLAGACILRTSPPSDEAGLCKTQYKANQQEKTLSNVNGRICYTCYMATEQQGDVPEAAAAAPSPRYPRNEDTWRNIP